MRRFWILLAAAALATPASANELRKVEFAALPGGIAVVSLALAEPLARPPGVLRMIYPAARIVLDLADTSVAPVRQTTRPEAGLVRAIRLLGYGGGTRVVIELARPATYEPAMEGNTLVITLRPTPSTPSSDRRRYTSGS